MPRLSLLRRLALCTAALGFLAGCGGGDGRAVVTMYTPHGKELLDDFEKRFETANPAIDLQWVDMGSQEVLERLRAEKANPQADLWFGAPSEMFERATAEGLLEPFQPTWSATVNAEAHDPQHHWYGTYLTPEVIGYNTEAVTAAEAPKDWDDVVDPKWKGKVILRDPVASGSMRAIFGGILIRSIQRTGSTAEGWKYLQALDRNTKEYTLNPPILYQKLGRQEGVITLYNMPDVATLRDRFKIPVEAVFPSSGTPLLVDGIALVKGGKNLAGARTAYEFMTSEAMMLAAARQHLRIPARNDIPADSLPQWIRDANAKMTPMPLDRQLVKDSLDVWMRYWDANVRNRFRGT